ncbi:hypothetical protein KCP75_16650 [Salmonella enterica subsp. enterica]|nr:hypothetical protein KCP75_16650 [Salmonella enterica subsp. enterica]
MHFLPTTGILTTAASLGCWPVTVQDAGSVIRVPSALAGAASAKYHQRATCMFDRHGLLALLAGRFLAFHPHLCRQQWRVLLACPTAVSVF